jgi:kojibiose phosphorylase
VNSAYAHVDPWVLRAFGFEEDLVARDGGNFLAGNGYLGVRGALEPWRAERFPAITVSDTYDMADGRWRELCTVPNGLYATLRDETGRELLGDTDSDRTVRELDLRTGTFRRRVAPRAAGGPRIATERFASYADLHLVASRIEVAAERTCELTLDAGIDLRVWSLNGDHFAVRESVREAGGSHATGPRLGVHAVTGERGTVLEVREALRVEGAEVVASEVVEDDERLLRRMRLRVPAGGTMRVLRAFAVASSNDVDPATDVAGDPAGAAVASVDRALRTGWATLLREQEADWRRFWAVADVRIDGDPELQRAARFALYHHRIATPEHSDRLPIGARGLSCQAYQGAAFWDQETYNLDVWLHTRPEVARNLLTYRARTLDGARAKARRLGYRGAFYAWISGDDGQELCPDWFFREVVTGRPIRNHFNDKQIHISPDIAATVAQYVDATGDDAFLIERGAEVLVEVARFLVSRVVWVPHRERWELHSVLGPDEYHEFVDDNAFTNHQAAGALEAASRTWAWLADAAPQRRAALSEALGLGEDEVAGWRDVAARLHRPGPDPATGVIEQFRGYMTLEDVTPDVLERRLIDPAEYWGWPIGVAVHTQVIKQADVLQLLVQEADTPADVLRANYDYYEPRTQHGSSLSPSVHAVAAARLGRAEEALRYFRKGALVDLGGDHKAVSGGTFIGGVHTAACAGTWQALAHGFGGLRDEDEGLGFDPLLPAAWTGFAFSAMRRGKRVRVDVAADRVVVAADEENPGPMPVRVGASRLELAPGERREVSSEAPRR